MWICGLRHASAFQDRLSLYRMSKNCLARGIGTVRQLPYLSLAGPQEYHRVPPQT